MDQYIGKILDDRYEVLDVLGVGGMAVVYKAYCHRLHRFVAIKVLKNDLAADAEFRRRFHAEAKAVAMLSHPNIVSVYDVSSSPEQDYIVMELIDGITLKQYMKTKGGPLSWREALHFITQIMRALGHAHGRGIIHRDIKPQNIMVLRDGSVKVADFGIARVMSAAQNTLTQEALGSVHYISPEQAKGSRIDARADIYSAGVVLYEMLTGRLPFEGDSAVSVAIQHISSTPLSPREQNPDIPKALETITMHAMASSIERRYINAHEMLHDLEEFRKNPQIQFSYVIGRNPTQNDFPDEGDEPTQVLKTTGETGRISRNQLRENLHNSPRGNSATKQEYGRDRVQKDKVATLPVIAVLAIFLLGTGVFLWVILFSGFFKPAPEYEIPNLVGKTLEEVYADSEVMKTFRIEKKEADYDSAYEEGEIIKQDPQTGTMVKGEELLITVTVNGHQEYVNMPDVYNKPYEEALKALQDLNLQVATPTYEPSDTVTKGYVVSFTPLEGVPMKPGETVNLVVSLGPKVKKVSVMSFVGETLENARKMITSNGLKIGAVNETADAKPAGTVIYQSIRAGSEVEEGTTISLQVSKGPEPQIPDPDHTKNIKITLPTDRETVSVRVTVDGEVQYDNVVNTLSSTIVHAKLDGKGVKKIAVYFDGTLVEEYELDFDE